MMGDEFQIGDIVKIYSPTPDTPDKYGRIKAVYYAPSVYTHHNEEYGVQIEGTTQLKHYRAWSLSKMPSTYILNALCGCGSVKLKHPGHSWYCDIESNKKILADQKILEEKDK